MRFLKPLDMCGGEQGTRTGSVEFRRAVWAYSNHPDGRGRLSSNELVELFEELLDDGSWGGDDILDGKLDID